MSFLSSVSDPAGLGTLPPPGDRQAARVGLERWQEAVADLPPPEKAAAAELAAPAGRRLLEALFGNSPFLTQCCLREPAFAVRLIAQGPDAIFAELLDGLNRVDATNSDRSELTRGLRTAKRRAALTVAVADIAGTWPLDRVTGALSDVAEGALGAAVRHLLAGGAKSGALALPHPDDPERESGLIVFGMGKLGARELNYSSDIDLILLFDPDVVRFTGRDSPHQFFARLAQDLLRIMADRTADGYVFRTDLRLRPDPASTPPVVSVPAALAYYESAGQNWERAALIKARPVAGDREAGRAFLAELTPFLWRKSLDFAAIQDIHSIKRQIDVRHGGGEIAVAGHNVKLGGGGIREIEFFAQTQQLIWGGRLPGVRVPRTCDALKALASHGRVTRGAAADLIETYRFLRRVEHRLQMVDDQQTHTLPSDDAGLDRIAAFLGFDGRAAFADELCRHLSRVESHYEELFEGAPTLGAAGGNLVFTGVEDDPDTLQTLSRLGYSDPHAVSAAIRGWHHGRYRATRSQRARELLTELVPALVEAFGRTATPQAAFLRFDQFLAHLPAGVQLFSLFQQNPGLLGLVAELMGTAPRLAEQLAERPALLDGVLSSDFFEPLPDGAALAADLDRALKLARDYQDVLDIARRWANDRKFQVGVQLLRHRIDADAAGFVYADIADAVATALLPRVEAELAQAHGRVPGGAATFIGLGKWGGREMTPTSDLDPILIYDVPEGVESSDGARPLPVPAYYARLTQRFINALTVPTAEGRLYEVDMRLRPSGNAGPIASSLPAFRRYHEELSWTWEHMALTRARPVAGDAALGERAMAAIGEALRRPRAPEKLLADVALMRRKMAAQHPNAPFWEVKHRRGGMIDVEFIAQYLELRDAASHPDIIQANTAAALRRLAAAGALDRATADDLIRAGGLWRRVQSLQKLLVAEPFDEETAPDTLKAILAQGANAVDFASLKNDMTDTAERVMRHFARLVDEPADALMRRPENPEENEP